MQSHATRNAATQNQLPNAVIHGETKGKTYSADPQKSKTDSQILSGEHSENKENEKSFLCPVINLIIIC